MSVSTFVPYCGHPPVPGDLAWNTDPVLIGALLAIGARYALRCRAANAPSLREQAMFGSGLGIVAGALISPLCNLSVALFSARVSQHMTLTLIAAPLIVLGRPERAFSALLHLPTPAGNRGQLALVLGGVSFAVAMWTWHMPAPYDQTLQNNYAYWLMHLTTFGAALLLWHALLRRSTTQPGLSLLVGFATALQMSLLGAVLTLAPAALFAVHSGTTWPWGLSPLQDQQLGGVIMWVPAGALFTLYGLAAFKNWLNAAGEQPIVAAVRQSRAGGLRSR
jgi:putative membrane protein